MMIANFMRPLYRRPTTNPEEPRPAGRPGGPAPSSASGPSDHVALTSQRLADARTGRPGAARAAARRAVALGRPAAPRPGDAPGLVPGALRRLLRRHRHRLDHHGR